MCFDLIELRDLKVRVELGVVDVDMTLVDGDLSGGAARRRRVAGDIDSLELLGAPELETMRRNIKRFKQVLFSS